MKMKLLLIIGLLTLLALTQCKSDKKVDTETTVNEIEETQGFGQGDQVVYMLPSPDEIFSEIFIDVVELNPEFVNPAANASSYVDIKSQAVNLGVYISDFAYLSAIDDSADELDYLKIIRDLTDKVNLVGIINEDLLNRINQNLMVKDSLNKISQELYYKMTQILENTDRNNILVLMSTGSIVEALYLAVNNIEFGHSTEMIQKIFEQKYVFDNYYEFASQYKDDMYVKTVLSELSVIKNMFDQFSYNETDINVTKDKDNYIIVEGGKEIVVTKESYLSFRENITNVRTLLVSISKSID